jgi:glycosyltransferase involved in cell wall biosynthesis
MTLTREYIENASCPTPAVIGSVALAGESPPSMPSGEPLRVVLVSTERGWHGGEGQALLLARGLRDRGHVCSIFARRGGLFAERMTAEGFHVTLFPGNGRNLWALIQIRGELARLRPHLLHMNDPHSITAAGVASIGLRVPARIASRRVDFPIRSTIRYRWLCDRVVCVSRAVARVCRECGLPERQLVVVHDGVDPRRVASGDRPRGRRSLGIQDHQPLLVSVATLTDHKGHKYLLQAMPQILRRRPETCLALAGDGDLIASLRRLAEQLGVGGSVRFLGYRDDVPDLIHAADVFVLPSHCEGLGSSLIDVMLAGRPIVTTTAGGIPDLVGRLDPAEPPVAWVVPTKRPDALAAAILEALDSPERCELLCRRARARAERRFTADRMVDATIAVYRDALRERALTGRAVAGPAARPPRR